MGEDSGDDPLSEALAGLGGGEGELAQELTDTAAALGELKAALGRLVERIADLERRAQRE